MSEENPKLAIIIIDSEKDRKGRYIPCIVKEGEKGYFLTNWAWGDDKDEAQSLADDYNTKLGVSKIDVQRLILGSMFGNKERISAIVQRVNKEVTKCQNTTDQR